MRRCLDFLKIAFFVILKMSRMFDHDRLPNSDVFCYTVWPEWTSTKCSQNQFSKLNNKVFEIKWKKHLTFVIRLNVIYNFWTWYISSFVSNRVSTITNSCELLCAFNLSESYHVSKIIWLYSLDVSVFFLLRNVIEYYDIVQMNKVITL